MSKAIQHFHTLPGTAMSGMAPFMKAGQRSISYDTSPSDMYSINPVGKPSTPARPVLGGAHNTHNRQFSTTGGSRTFLAPANTRLTHLLTVGPSPLPRTEAPVVLYTVKRSECDRGGPIHHTDTSERLGLLYAHTKRANPWSRDHWDNAVVMSCEEYNSMWEVPSDPLYARSAKRSKRAQKDTFHRKYRCMGILAAYMNQNSMMTRVDSAGEMESQGHFDLTILCKGDQEVTGVFDAITPTIHAPGSPAYHYVAAIEPGIILKMYLGYFTENYEEKAAAKDRQPHRKPTARIQVVVKPTQRPDQQRSPGNLWRALHADAQAMIPQPKP